MQLTQGKSQSSYNCPQGSIPSGPSTISYLPGSLYFSYTASLLFIEHIIYTHASKPLHWHSWFLLHETLFPYISTWLTPSHSSSLCLISPYSWGLSKINYLKIYPLPSYSPPSFFSALFFFLVIITYLFICICLPSLTMSSRRQGFFFSLAQAIILCQEHA